MFGQDFLVFAYQWSPPVEEFSKQSNIDAVDALMDEQDEYKLRLDDPDAIRESVAYLRHHGFMADEIQRCLIRYFYVDLDMLHEALVTH